MAKRQEWQCKVEMCDEQNPDCTFILIMYSTYSGFQVYKFDIKSNLAAILVVLHQILSGPDSTMDMRFQLCPFNAQTGAFISARPPADAQAEVHINFVILSVVRTLIRLKRIHSKLQGDKN